MTKSAFGRDPQKVVWTVLDARLAVGTLDGSAHDDPERMALLPAGGLPRTGGGAPTPNEDLFSDKNQRPDHLILVWPDGR